jgi:hypothetical protein
VRALALWLLMAGQAAADMVSINGTSVVLQDSDAPGAVAQVVMSNVNRNDQSDEGDYSLTHNGLSVTVTFDWETTVSGHDRMTVTVPPGFIAVPEFLDVAEYGTGTILIFSVDGVGM